MVLHQPPPHFYRKHAAKQIVWDEQILRHQDFDFSIRFADKFHFKVDHTQQLKSIGIKYISVINRSAVSLSTSRI